MFMVSVTKPVSVEVASVAKLVRAQRYLLESIRK